jgi:hypothetical protein
MNRLFALVVLGLLAATTIGCEPKMTSERQTKVSTPGGTTTTTDTHKVESTGDNPPANGQGEVAK